MLDWALDRPTGRLSGRSQLFGDGRLTWSGLSLISERDCLWPFFCVPDRMAALLDALRRQAEGWKGRGCAQQRPPSDDGGRPSPSQASLHPFPHFLPGPTLQVLCAWWGLASLPASRSLPPIPLWFSQASSGLAKNVGELGGGGHRKCLPSSDNSSSCRGRGEGRAEWVRQGRADGRCGGGGVG